MDVIECIKNRRSVRKFSDKKLEYDTIMELIDISVNAPTAQSREPWGFLVLHGKNKLKEISDFAKVDILDKIDELPHFKKYEHWFRDPEYNLFYDSENLVVIYGDTNSNWYKEDCSCLTQNMILSAFDRGIGSCWIGFAEFALNDEKFRKEYNIPENYSVVSALIMGYMDRETKPPKRRTPIIFNESELGV